MNISTGFNRLDNIINHLHRGDNVLWRIDSIDNYLFFSDAFASISIEKNKPVVYFRYGSHKAILREQPGVRIIQSHPENSFVTFIRVVLCVHVAEGFSHLHANEIEVGCLYIVCKTNVTSGITIDTPALFS